VGIARELELLDVRPRLTVQDALYGRSVDPKPYRELWLGNAAFTRKAADFTHSVISEFRHPAAFSSRHFFPMHARPTSFAAGTSALSDAIVHVFLVGSKEKVDRIYAKWLISVGAVVANVHSFRNWLSGMQYPANAM